MDLDEQELKATREKSADEMFKELGYYQLKVLGAQECDFSNGKGKEIIFTKNKKVGLYGIYNWISMQELQAINKKCKEMRVVRMSKKTIVFDFDGVIHKGYKGWKDGSIYGELDYELLDYINNLMDKYYIVISSNRPAKQIVDYMNADKKVPFRTEIFNKDMQGNMYWNKDYVVGVTNEKAVGIIYIDDRGYRYNGLADLQKNLKEVLK